MKRIVVGVDGSEGSHRALQWAGEEARLRGVRLEVVHSYEPLDLPPELSLSREQSARLFNGPLVAAEDLLKKMVEGLDGVEVESHVVESSSPALVLIERSKGATMLVVSARGLGSFRSLLMGSVSQQVAHHAECPVVIVRHIAEDG